MIGNLCLLPEGGVDHTLLVAFKSDYSLDDLLDLEEISQVGRSWRDAAQANTEERSESERRARERKRDR